MSISIRRTHKGTPDRNKRRGLNMKKILAIVLAAVMLLSMTACGAAAKKDTYVVGICQLVQHDALDAATKGFQDALTEALGD